MSLLKTFEAIIKRKSGNLMIPVASLSIMFMKSCNSSLVGFSPTALKRYLKIKNIKIIGFKINVILSPEQISKKIGWKDPVPVRHPVEVIQEQPDSVLRDELHHDHKSNH